MGMYINPKDISKEAWLGEKGEPLLAPPLKHTEDGKVAVCFVNNGWMTAAGVCYSKDELEAFTQPSDNRPKDWYLVSINDLIAVGAIQEASDIH